MDRYPTVADVTDSARRLVTRFPGAGRLRRIGTSRAGRPLWMLSVGHGPRHVLVVARPHPDEPVGGATALALAERVARGDGLTPATDPALVTWDIVLCLDPDGAALTEGVEEATATLKGYYGTAFRPVAAEQPEWAPIESRQLPESQALFEVVDELRPVLQCSLHSVDAGGSWVQLTRELPGLASAFAESAAALGLPLQHGTYDALYWDNPSPGIHVLPPPGSSARLAAGSENFDRSTWCAPSRYGGVTAIVEVPMWATDLADDRTPHPDPATALRDLSRLVRDGGRQVTAIFDKARAFLPPPEENALCRVLEWMADDLYDLVADSWTPLAERSDPALTRADICALDVVARRQPLRAAGLLLRLLARSDDRAAPALHQELDALFTVWATDFAQALRLRRVPVSHQAEHQTRTVLAAADSALKLTPAPR
ncbi:hydroxylacyl-CoA dehydrogenase [Streptomyces sp. NBRC 14336]|uniref:M14 family zinc carboxypeptidase n=1 Tax=Streptomyces sp. NBRC 14336 TaxID=3030992 RepID=UPI0024A5E377|nr:M14 family zinc carboxypeptidase [Streptomyces sp. NBRC 14336]WBO80146.1 M14 family zinc carboxypeptidase [Streptomyces sp. SBE_14.2]GLW44724.1 hydroxylacyl-CoA dehydrogenase [Streptomyces sp. NBRC 14336]